MFSKSMKSALLALGLICIVTDAVSADLWRAVIHRGRDPSTPPQTMVECVNWAYPLPGVKICIGHALRCKHMNSELVVRVTGPDGNEVKDKVMRCAETSAAKAAVSGILVGWTTGGMAGGSAALGTFTDSIKSCVGDALSGSINSVLDNPNAWDDNWGSC